ncbi:1804_t:CDS:1, partial [Entrophospora sp. SA101]
KKARQDYIIEVFSRKNKNSLSQCIPVTQQEENELRFTRVEILKRIEQLLNQVDNNINLKYSTIVSKKKSELIDILNELENLQKENTYNEEEIIN